MSETTTSAVTPAEYEQTVTQLCTDPVVMRIAYAVPEMMPLDRLFGADGHFVSESAARKLNFLYWVGCRQADREVPELPVGAVLEAVRRVAREAGLI